jgi:transcriptional regulator with XRE-family HTH domain
MLLGDQIQYIRRLKKMERKEVAERLGISVQQYSNIENNISQIDEDRLDNLSRIFNVDKDHIIGVDTEKILHQINHDNSTGYNEGTINHNDPDLIARLVDKQNKLIDMLDKQNKLMDMRLSAIEGHIKDNPGEK